MINSLAIGLAFAFLVLRLFNRRQESNLALFIAVAVAICDIISACVGRAYDAAFAASGLTFPVMADTANTAATSFAVAATIPRLRWLGLLLGGLATLNEFTVQGASPPEVVAGFAIAVATILLLQRAFRRFGLLPLTAVINQQENRQ